jgi:hypothetical protein
MSQGLEAQLAHALSGQLPPGTQAVATLLPRWRREALRQYQERLQVQLEIKKLEQSQEDWRSSLENERDGWRCRAEEEKERANVRVFACWRTWTLEHTGAAFSSFLSA